VKRTSTNKQETRERIKESRYNKEYERCITEKIAKYLERKKNYDEGGERKQILNGRRGKKVQNVF
jgi:hypothetical protein